MNEGAQDKMESEYNLRENQAMLRTRLKYAAEAGLLIFVKWGLFLFLIIFVFNYFTEIRSGSQNGTQSAIYLNMLQREGYLPKIDQNGQIPKKEVRNEETSSNSSPAKP